MNGNLIRNLVFLRGSYAVNNRLSVSGTAFYEVGRFGTKDQNANLSSKGFIIGADYKTGEKSAVSFSIEISDRSSPFLYSPLHSPYQGSSALPDR
ncbi:MAG: hypothetical protein KJ607_08745 [Bacteroidetes bacterium]|nr:hypothetical protein [Bacteroidota bacterium]